MNSVRYEVARRSAALAAWRRLATRSRSKRAMTSGRSAAFAERSNPVASDQLTVTAVPSIVAASSTPAPASSERAPARPDEHEGLAERGPHTSSTPSLSAQHAGGGVGRGLFVGHEHDGPALPRDLAQHVEHDRRRLRVEVPGGLVGEHDRRVVDERPRERDALLLAAGQLVRHPAGGVGQPEALDELAAALQGARRGVGQARGQRDVLLARQLRDEVEELEHEPDPPSPQPRRDRARSDRRRARRPARSSPPRPCRGRRAGAAGWTSPSLDRPTTATSSPPETSRAAPSSTRRAARPCPKVLTRPCARTIGDVTREHGTSEDARCAGGGERRCVERRARTADAPCPHHEEGAEARIQARSATPRASFLGRVAAPARPRPAPAGHRRPGPRGDRGLPRLPALARMGGGRCGRGRHGRPAPRRRRGRLRRTGRPGPDRRARRAAARAARRPPAARRSALSVRGRHARAGRRHVRPRRRRRAPRAGGTAPGWRSTAASWARPCCTAARRPSGPSARTSSPSSSSSPVSSCSPARRSPASSGPTHSGVTDTTRALRTAVPQRAPRPEPVAPPEHEDEEVHVTQTMVRAPSLDAHLRYPDIFGDPADEPDPDPELPEPEPEPVAEEPFEEDEDVVEEPEGEDDEPEPDGVMEIRPEDLTPQGRLRGSITDDPSFQWKTPRPNILKRSSAEQSKPDTAGQERTAGALVEALGHFGVQAKVIGMVAGPAHHALRAAARARHQDEQGRPAQGRPRVRPGRDGHPHPRARSRQDRGRRRGPQPAAPDGAARRRLPGSAGGLVAAHRVAGQGRRRQGDRRGPGQDAAPARRGHDRRGQVGRDQRDALEHPAARDAPRRAARPRRPQAGRAQPLRVGPAPAHAGHHEPADGRQRAPEPREGDGGALLDHVAGPHAVAQRAQPACARGAARRRCRTSCASSTSSPTS